MLPFIFCYNDRCTIFYLLKKGRSFMGKNKYVFWGLVITTLISALDANIMQTASPTIVKQLGGMELFAWVFSVYMLASTITVPLYGKLSDMYGRKKLLMISVGLFTIGSIFCGMALTASWFLDSVNSFSSESLRKKRASLPICKAISPNAPRNWRWRPTR